VNGTVDRFSDILLARLYPFEIGAILDDAWIAGREPNFFRQAAVDRHAKKS
jgi:hypothetical protein